MYLQRQKTSTGLTPLLLPPAQLQPESMLGEQPPEFMPGMLTQNLSLVTVTSLAAMPLQRLEPLFPLHMCRI